MKTSQFICLVNIRKRRRYFLKPYNLKSFQIISNSKTNFKNQLNFTKSHTYTQKKNHFNSLEFRIDRRIFIDSEPTTKVSFLRLLHCAKFIFLCESSSYPFDILLTPKNPQKKKYFDNARMSETPVKKHRKKEKEDKKSCNLFHFVIKLVCGNFLWAVTMSFLSFYDYHQLVNNKKRKFSMKK